jgi:hypothetical protein
MCTLNCPYSVLTSCTYINPNPDCYKKVQSRAARSHVRLPGDQKEAGIHKITTTNRWKLLLFDIKKTFKKIYLTHFVRNRFWQKIFLLQATLSFICSKLWESYAPQAIRIRVNICSAFSKDSIVSSFCSWLLLIVCVIVHYSDTGNVFLYNVFTKSTEKKYNADTKLQERSQEKHMVIWL